MHVDGRRAHTQSHLDTTTRIVGISYRYGPGFCQLRRIALHHLLIHNKATCAEDHALAGSVVPLLHILSNHEPHNPLLWSKLINDESQCSGF